ncbi:MAG: NADH-quinone oxidoreductase subunit L [Pirellulales bacterium]
MKLLLVLIPALPLAASLVTAALGRRVLGARAHWPALLCVAASFVCSLALVRDVHIGAKAAEIRQSSVGYEEVYTLWRWAAVEQHPPSQSHDFIVDVTLRADPLTAIMLATVTLISFFVVLYSIGYMHGDRSYPRFFATISLFVFAMTMLVSVSNFAMLYVFWELVGACSYLLIGYWFEKPEAAAAGKKAFLVNRVGDFGFAIALFLIWTNYHTLDFHDAATVQATSEERVVSSVLERAPGVLGQERLGTNDFVTGTIGAAIAMLLLVGACGKSAQFPLHVWLPDAMEGPTPVSALIHAATMVTAGVYLVVRCAPLFMVSDEARLAVACVGGISAVIAGLIAVTETDLKRVLAYSTIGQLGYMFLSLGTGTLAGFVAGMFHLFTHAFFKALLFLGAGSVMHAMGGVIDMRRFGGLRRLMPITSWTFLAGALALAGFPLTSGFWSKDGILAALRDAGEPDQRFHEMYEGLFYVALVMAGVTAFYTFRAYFLTFYGPERIPHEAHHHAHESPASMTVPLALLSVPALGIGGLLAATGGFIDYLRLTPSLASAAIVPPGAVGEMHWDIAMQSGLVAVGGIALAAYLYLGELRQAEWFARMLAPLYWLSRRKFFFDDLYLLLVVLPIRLVAALCYAVDRWLIDALVDLVARVPPLVGKALRPVQNGLVQFYALAMLLVLVVLAVVLFR